MKKKNSKKRVIIVGIVIVLLMFLSIGVMYVGNYYPVDAEAVAAWSQPDAGAVEVLEDGTVVLVPEEPRAGLIFYPGGKVEYTAYEPLMEALSAEGVLCALLEMPFNLAIFGIDEADGLREQYPEITDWYIGGHSLGGSAAAIYLKEHAAEFEGLILLGSYSTADLSATDLRVLSVYGSEDTVVDAEIYAENKANLPADFTEYIIEGGCHAGFGMYGAQVGDGTPAITNVEQIQITAAEIVKLIEQ